MPNNVIIWIVGLLSASVGAYLFKLYSLIFYQIRLDNDDASKFYNSIKDKPKRLHFYITEEYKKGLNLPRSESVFIVMNGVPFLLNIHEQILQAGFTPTANITTLTTLRIFRRRLYSIINDNMVDKEQTVSINVLMGGYFSKSNELKTSKNIILPPQINNDIIVLLEQFMNGQREKLGLLFYGSPGNGKTSTIKSIALKYNLEVYVVVLSQEISNADLLSAFMRLPQDKKVIVVFEDFDNSFNKRQSQYDPCKFTFDMILNLIDGIYVKQDNILFIMTANDINKIDHAIKNRPSRFDYVVHLENPQMPQRIEILKSFGLNGEAKDIADLTENRSSALLCEIGKRYSFNKKITKSEIELIIKSFDN